MCYVTHLSVRTVICMLEEQRAHAPTQFLAYTLYPRFSCKVQYISIQLFVIVHPKILNLSNKNHLSPTSSVVHEERMIPCFVMTTTAKLPLCSMCALEF
jgi:hypothetical protein